jgi:CheY-like chemotaxis protein
MTSAHSTASCNVFALRAGDSGAVPLRAVIVDDSVEFLRAARFVLESEGVVVVAGVSTGAEALRCAQEHDPDVVLVDVGLGWESGFDVAEQLSLAAGRRGLVILISARSEEDFAELVESSPAIGFVSKTRFTGYAVVELLKRRGRTGAAES